MEFSISLELHQAPLIGRGVTGGVDDARQGFEPLPCEDVIDEAVFESHMNHGIFPMFEGTATQRALEAAKCGGNESEQARQDLIFTMNNRKETNSM